MALLQNRTTYASDPYRRVGGTATTTDGAGLRSMLGMRSSFMLQVFAGGIDSTSSAPVGYTPQGHIFPPRRSGGMGAGNSAIVGAGAISNADLINAIRLIVASLAGSGNVTGADGRNTLPAVANLTGSGGITNAGLVLIANAIASLSGTGTISAGLAGSLSALASLAGSGGVVGAIGAIAGLVAGVAGAGSLAAQPYGPGSLAATLRGYSDLTPEGIRDKVWQGTATSFNDAGTMGQKLNSAASGGVDYNALAAAVWAYATRTTTSDSAAITTISKILRNKTVTDPVAGTITVYDDNGTTVLFTAPLWQDAAGSTPYAGNGADRRDRLV